MDTRQPMTSGNGETIILDEHNQQCQMTGFNLTDKEVMVIAEFKTYGWSSENDMPHCSTSEQITVALALNRNDLLPKSWTDPLDGYINRLNDRQRKIVDNYRF